MNALIQSKRRAFTVKFCRLAVLAIITAVVLSATCLFAVGSSHDDKTGTGKPHPGALEDNINSIPVILPEPDTHATPVKTKATVSEVKTSKPTEADKVTEADHSKGEHAKAHSVAHAAEEAKSANSNSVTEIHVPKLSKTKPEMVSTDPEQLKNFQLDLDLAKTGRRQKALVMATKLLVGILETNAPAEIQRPALYELALLAQDDNQLVKAQQIFSQYIQLFPDDPSAPEVLLRQGLIYRQMGATTMAIGKFYSVMSSALKLKLDNMDYYKKLVLQAQMEIADTYYGEGKFTESADYFNRLLKSELADQDKVVIQYKLIRSLSFLPDTSETIARAQAFIEKNPSSPEIPEVRFLLAATLKKVGRNQESMKQVLALLQSQEANAKHNPETWIYWQQRAGNDIANQLYREGEYFGALQIYQTLAELDRTPSWQLPVWYQIGLVYEQLQQPERAKDTYSQILAREKEITDTNKTPTLLSLLEMAKWRKDYMDWLEKSRVSTRKFKQSQIGSPSSVSSK